MEIECVNRSPVSELQMENRVLIARIPHSARRLAQLFLVDHTIITSTNDAVTASAPIYPKQRVPAINVSSMPGGTLVAFLVACAT